MGYKDPNVKREKQREYMRLYRATRKEFHLCERCKGQDAFTLAGRKLCADCRDRENDYKREYYAKISLDRNKKVQEKRDERRERHCCTTCGKELPESYTYLTCEQCRASSRTKKERARIWDGKMDRETMRELGLCVRCGAPRMEGEKAFGGEIMLCESCYRKSCESLKIARAAYEAKYGHTWGQAQAACDGLGRSRNREAYL